MKNNREVENQNPELYTTERIAELLLNNAVDAEDYERAREQVKKLGLDADLILHHKPD